MSVILKNYSGLLKFLNTKYQLKFVFNFICLIFKLRTSRNNKNAYLKFIVYIDIRSKILPNIRQSGKLLYVALLHR